MKFVHLCHVGRKEGGAMSKSAAIWVFILFIGFNLSYALILYLCLSGLTLANDYGEVGKLARWVCITIACSIIYLLLARIFVSDICLEWSGKGVASLLVRDP